LTIKYLIDYRFLLGKEDREENCDPLIRDDDDTLHTPHTL